MTGSSPTRRWLVSATGNRFVLHDARSRPLEGDVPELARRVSSAAGVDGLLVLAPGQSPGADGRMLLWNADGSRAEACGNGLRCVAFVVSEALAGSSAESASAGTSVRIDTDAGPRDARVWCATGESSEARVRVSMGEIRHGQAAERLSLRSGAELDVWIADAGNPHAVLFVDDVERADVHGLGAALERHPRFPARTNVEFVEVRADRLRVRIWERGVGETRSCGTGVTAAACVARRALGIPLPIRVESRGGELHVAEDGGAIHLEGEARIESVIPMDAELDVRERAPTRA